MALPSGGCAARQAQASNRSSHLLPGLPENSQADRQPLVEQQAAVIVTDREAPEKLIPEIRSLIQDAERRTSLGLRCRAMGLPGAAAMIVDEILKLGSGD